MLVLEENMKIISGDGLKRCIGLLWITINDSVSAISQLRFYCKYDFIVVVVIHARAFAIQEWSSGMELGII